MKESKKQFNGCLHQQKKQQKHYLTPEEIKEERMKKIIRRLVEEVRSAGGNI